MISYKVKGLKVLQNRLNKTIEDLNKLDSIIEKEAKVMQRNAKKDVPVDTRKLYRSISVKNESQGKKISFKVYSKTKYAPYIDTGTGDEFQSRPFNYHEFDDYFSDFRKYRKPLVPTKPQPYFFSNYILSRRSLKREYNKLFKRLYAK